MNSLKLNPGHLTPYGREHLSRLPALADLLDDHEQIRLCNLLAPPILGGSGSASNWCETTTLAHWTGQDNGSWANLSPGYLALCTTVPDSSKTGSTIIEANYTGYARASVGFTTWAAAVSGGAGGASSETTSATITFAACSGGSSTIVGWAYCTAVTAGNVIVWGSCASTVISTTQTPANVQAGALQLQLT